MSHFKECFFQRYPIHNLSTVFSKQSEQMATKAKSIFVEDNYKDADGNLVAEITFLDDLPILKFYTADPVLKAQSQAKLTASYMVDLYNSFIQFLPLAARLKSGHLWENPIQFVGEEIRRRQLDFSYVDVELHYMLIEFNAYIAQHNKTAYTGLTLTPFTMDDLKAFLTLCDVYKGIGCSAALRKTDNGGYEFIRNLDWEPLNVLGNHTLGLMTCTGNKDLTKPQTVFSISFTPGILGLSMVNDKGLIITLNEATMMHTKRENTKPNAIPQFILVRQLIENCSTIEEVKAYLDLHQPATSHLLSVMDAQGNYGIFEMLPNKGPYSNTLYHFREPSLDTGTVHVSNHFLNDKEQPISGSEGFDCSFDRFENMMHALNNNENALKIARSTNVHDSIQTLIFKKHGEELSLYLNWSNGYSATAVDPLTNQLRYTKIDIKKELNRYAEQISKQTINTMESPSVHQTLIQLMRTSYEIGHFHETLGYDLNCFYSELVNMLATHSAEESSILNLATDMQRLMDSLQNDQQINFKFKPFYNNKNANLLWICPVTLLTLCELITPSISVFLFASAFVYQNSDTLLGKTKEHVYRDKVVNEVERIKNQAEKPTLQLQM